MHIILGQPNSGNAKCSNYSGFIAKLKDTACTTAQINNNTCNKDGSIHGNDQNNDILCAPELTWCCRMNQCCEKSKVLRGLLNKNCKNYYYWHTLHDILCKCMLTLRTVVINFNGCWANMTIIVCLVSIYYIVHSSECMHPTMHVCFFFFFNY